MEFFKGAIKYLRLLGRWFKHGAFLSCKIFSKKLEEIWINLQKRIQIFKLIFILCGFIVLVLHVAVKLLHLKHIDYGQSFLEVEPKALLRFTRLFNVFQNRYVLDSLRLQINEVRNRLDFFAFANLQKPSSKESIC